MNSEAPGLTAVLEGCRTRPPNILKGLLALQEAWGYVPVDRLSEIAEGLEVTEADLAGVLSYYPELRTSRAGCHHVRVCMGESCVANHAARTLAAFENSLNIRVGSTTADGRFTLQRIYCVGNCAVAPSVMVDGHVHGRVTPEQVGSVLEDYR